MHTHLEQWAADTAAPREQLGVRSLAQGSHHSRGQFLPEPRFEPTTSGYKSDALFIRATTAPSSNCGSHVARLLSKRRTICLVSPLYRRNSISSRRSPADRPSWDGSNSELKASRLRVIWCCGHWPSDTKQPAHGAARWLLATGNLHRVWIVESEALEVHPKLPSRLNTMGSRTR